MYRVILFKHVRHFKFTLKYRLLEVYIYYIISVLICYETEYTTSVSLWEKYPPVTIETSGLGTRLENDPQFQQQTELTSTCMSLI